MQSNWNNLLNKVILVYERLQSKHLPEETRHDQTVKENIAMWQLEKDSETKQPVHDKVDLDTILVNEIGPFGRYQIKTLALAGFAVVFAAFHGEYIFTTARIKTRCFIPECEDAMTAVFTPGWVYNAVPASGASFDKCHRFGNATFLGKRNDTCPAGLFNTKIVEECEERVYEHNLTVVYDFDLGCDEWRRSIIGTARKIGSFPALPFTGYISDRWGRRSALVINCFNAAWIGLARYWINSYPGFVVSEMFESFFGAGIFSSIYILVVELVGPEYRVIAGGILSSFFAFGNVLMGMIAWAVPNWRSLTLALYIPQLITIGYLWCISESVRWYMSKGRYAESEAQLKEVARINKKQLSDKSLELLKWTAEEEKIRKALEELRKSEEPWLVLLVLKHKQILIRCLVLPLWWMTATLTYYGLSINSMNISGNQYVNYIAVAAVEIPGFFSAVVLLNKIGRKPVLIGAFWVCAACQFAYIFMPTGQYAVSLTLYLLGKCAIAMVMASIYVYTTELFPTKYRHNLLAYCSMIGRLGSITAPLTPAFGAATFQEMPFVLFGSFALVSGCLVLLTPETLGSKLPDTMEEAELLGN